MVNSGRLGAGEPQYQRQPPTILKAANYKTPSLLLPPSPFFQAGELSAALEEKWGASMKREKQNYV